MIWSRRGVTLRLSLAIVLLIVCGRSLSGAADEAGFPDGYPNTAATADRRFGYAQFYLGVDALYVPSWQSRARDSNGAEFALTVPARVIPRFAIGAFHEWGHVDFSIAFGLDELRVSSDHEGYETQVEHGSTVGFGVHYFPWAIAPGRLTPFVGANPWSYIGVVQARAHDRSKNGTFDKKPVLPLVAGLGYASKIGFWELGTHYIFDSKLRIFLDRDTKATVELPHFATWFGYRVVRDGTIASKKHESELGTNGFELAVGPSGPTTWFEPSTRSESRPYLQQRQLHSNDWPEFAAGYYFKAQ